MLSGSHPENNRTTLGVMSDAAEERVVRSAVVFLAWGGDYIAEVRSCLDRSAALAGHDVVLLTDRDTDVSAVDHRVRHVVRIDFIFRGLLRKVELHRHLPEGYDTFLYLDSDTEVLGDVSLGFSKAALHGIALAPAPHYSLDRFWDFDRIMREEGVPELGQLQYNTGVIFFRNTPDVAQVFERWAGLASAYGGRFPNDQPYFTLAMEQCGFSPHTLSPCYNYRGFGDPISGPVRIWHSHGRAPVGLNDTGGREWPRRRAWASHVEPAPPGGAGWWSRLWHELRWAVARARHPD